MLKQALKITRYRKTGCNALIAAAVSLCLFCGTVSAADEAGGRPVFEPGALEFAGIYRVLQQEPNLTGHSVQIAAICSSQTYINHHPQDDYRFNMNHDSLYDADVRFTDGTDGRLGTSAHATAIAGILLGLEETVELAGGELVSYRGVCPDATVTVHEFWRFVIMHLYGNRSFEADLITLSLGEMFETWWTRAIERMAEQKDVLVIASIGNGADVMTPRPLYPGAGCNVLGVGVADSVMDELGRADLRNFGQVRQAHSSMGPTGDLRCKPDIVAPGTALVPVSNHSSEYQIVENWSSISAPIVCGTAALLLQQANENQLLKEAMEGGRALVLKSVLMNSARKLPYWHKGQPGGEDDHETPLDLLQGAGLLDATAALNQLTSGGYEPGDVRAQGWDNRVLEKGAWGYEYAFAVAEPSHVVTATLCWNRDYAAGYPYTRQLENDADLRLELWGIDPNLSQETLLDYSDSVNDNTEHIYFACDPNFTHYALRVKLNESSTSSTAQRFALAWSAGPNRQDESPWWYDLNDDLAIDPTDQLIYAMLEEGILANSDLEINESLKLTAERITLLSSHWNQWKPYLNDYAQAVSEILLSDN